MTPKIEHNREIPTEYERHKWKSLAEKMKVGDHVTCQTAVDMQALANALSALGHVPRVHKPTLTVFRRL